jgi:hypothetical protein
VYESASAVPAIQGDAIITGELTLSLRARRSGGSSRMYEIFVSCADFAGNTAGTTVVATVPPCPRWKLKGPPLPATKVRSPPAIRPSPSAMLRPSGGLGGRLTDVSVHLM